MRLCKAHAEELGGTAKGYSAHYFGVLSVLSARTAGLRRAGEMADEAEQAQCVRELIDSERYLSTPKAHSRLPCLPASLFPCFQAVLP